MKILICSLTYALPNGVTVSINTSIDGFNERGVKSLVISPDYDIGETRKEHRIAPASAILRSIGVLIGKEERTFGLGASARIRRVDEEFKPDAYWLHTITWAPNAFERFMFKSNKPKVVFYHTMVEEYGRIYAGEIGAATMRRRSKAVCNKADAIIIPSEMMKAKLIEYGVTKPIHVIPTGIMIPEKQLSRKDICKRFDIDPKSKILLHVGRVSKEKNLDVLLRATKKINDSGINATLLFVGPGDIDEIAGEADKLGIGKRTVLTGGLPKAEAQGIYAGCDAFVFSSQTETQGLVIGEAMTAGAPVVALRSPIQAEVYPEGTAAIADDESEFVKNLIAVLEGGVETERMIKTAKKFVEKNFSQKLMIDRQLKVFRELIARKGKA